MKSLNCEIRIGGFVFYQTAMVDITSSYKELVETCLITLPRKTRWQGKNINLGSEGLIKKGNAVTIKLGYDNDLNEVFKGWLNKIGAGFPITLEVDNDGYLLKRQPVKPKEFKTATLKEVLKYILPTNIYKEAKIADVNLGKFQILDETNAAKVINEIQDQYTLYTFFRQGKLYSGLPVWPEYQNTVNFAFGHNIISDSLKFINEEDLKLRVKAVSILSDNKKLEVEVGDKEGVLHTVNVNYIDNTKDLNVLANKRLEALRYTGLHGNFTTFGQPQVLQGDLVKLFELLEPSKEREGTYRVEKVRTVFGYEQAYRQIITLGKKQ